MPKLLKWYFRRKYRTYVVNSITLRGDKWGFLLSYFGIVLGLLFPRILKPTNLASGEALGFPDRFNSYICGLLEGSYAIRRISGYLTSASFGTVPPPIWGHSGARCFRRPRFPVLSTLVSFRCVGNPVLVVTPSAQ